MIKTYNKTYYYMFFCCFFIFEMVIYRKKGEKDGETKEIFK